MDLRPLSRGLRYGAAVVLAGALVFYVARGGGGRPAAPPVGVYTLASPGPIALTPGAPLELALRPSSPSPPPPPDAGAPVVAYVFAMGLGEPSPVDAKVEVLPDGVVRLRGTVPRALAGASELRVVLGDASAFHRYDDAMTRAREGVSDAQVRVIAVPVTTKAP